MRNNFVLLIMAQEQNLLLSNVLSSLDLEPLKVTTCEEARRLLAMRLPIDLIITEVTLGDGNWSDVLRYMVDHDIQARVLLTCRSADERLWSEALWRGVYDLLVEPYESREVRRIIEGVIRARHQTESAAGAGQ